MLYLFLALIAITLGVLVFKAQQKPDTFSITRSRTFNAPAHTVFGLMHDFYNMRLWSAWDKMDPNVRWRYSGAHSGVGAQYDWQGNNKVGMGQMEIIESQFATHITVALRFIKPFAANNTAHYQFTETPDGCRVDWTMTGPLTFMQKIMHVIVNVDKMVGRDFEQSLANIALVLEDLPQDEAAYEINTCRIVEATLPQVEALREQVLAAIGQQTHLKSTHNELLCTAMPQARFTLLQLRLRFADGAARQQALQSGARAMAQNSLSATAAQLAATSN